MVFEFKNVEGTQEQDNYLDDLALFEALSQEEIFMLLRDQAPAQLPAMQPTVDPPGSCDLINISARRLQLSFSTPISSPVLTSKKIKGQGRESVEVVLIDGHTGKQVVSGPEASVEVEIVVLKQVFSSDRDDDWTIEEFDKNIVTMWHRKKSLLAEPKKLKLKEGRGVLDEISFTHNRNWSSKTKFRLGARIVDDFIRARVREAKTEPFELKDCRLQCNRKHNLPSMNDKVWRLKKIYRGGKRHRRLREAKINTVKDFLILLFLNTQNLREIYGRGGKDWDETVSHALRCPEKMVCYPTSSRQQTGVVVNASVEVLGLLSQGKFLHIDKLSDAIKANAEKSVISAFECPEANVDYFDDTEDVKPNAPNVLDFPRGHDFGTDKIIDDHYNYMQPSTSTQDRFGRAHKRWKIFSKVWSGAWFFMKKMTAASFHAKKKLRLY